MSALIDPDAIGVEVSWSFGDGNAEAVTLDRKDLRALLIKHGFDPKLVNDVNEEAALRLAQHTAKGRSKQYVIQELRKPNKDTPRAYGVYKVIGTEGEAGDDWKMGARVRCGTGEIHCFPPEGQSFFPESTCESIGNNIARLANSLIENVINRDISDILVAIGWNELGWISRRRNSGGVYFVGTSDTAQRFVELLQSLDAMAKRRARHMDRPCDHYFVPQVMEVYAKPLTMEMWKTSAADQYASQTDKLLKDLQKMQGPEGDKMRTNTVQSYADDCDRLIRQAESHSVFLQDAAEGITNELSKLRAAFSVRLDKNAAEAIAACDEATVAQPLPLKRRRVRKRVQPVELPPASEMSNDELFEVFPPSA